jgi:uncharacterized protein YceH (UPF0502 family)
METRNFLEEFERLVSAEDLLTVNNEANELKTAFQDYILEEERKIQVAKLDSEQSGEEFHEDNQLKQLKDTFYSQYNAYKEKKTALLTSQKLEQEANLRIKKNLIDRLKNLIQEEENIGVAVATYKEIHETWKTVGDIPREKRQDIQNEYSKLLESFFFNLKIYRELKEHDLKRNSQLKRELIDRLKKLLQSQTVKEIESSIKQLQNEFDEIGPVVQTEWEEIKQEYWELVKAIYAKINDFYEQKRSELASNIELKKNLLEEVSAFVSELEPDLGVKEWEDNTQILLAFQQKWKEIGFGTKKENEELWQSFRELCDLFFTKKKAFFDTLKEKNAKVEETKRQLIEKVNAIKDSVDWKKTTDEIIRLQNEWKKSGHASQKVEQQLWREFRGACDSFFNHKQKHFEESDKQNEANLSLKKDIIAKIEGYVPSADKKQVLADLRDFSAAFNTIGKVPFKEKDAVYEAYKKAIDKHYQQLKLEGEEKDKAMFQAKMDAIKANPNAEKMIDRERRDLQQQITNLRQEINQFENNLGFFANSKGADSLKKEVEQKINAAKRKIEDYQRKLKLLVNEQIR